MYVRPIVEVDQLLSSRNITKKDNEDRQSEVLGC